MIRVLVFLTLTFSAGLVAIWVANQSGTLSLVLGDTRYETTLGVGLVAIILIATTLGILWTVLRLIIHGPDALSGFMLRRRRAKGLDAVARGLVAVGVGDERGAKRAARDARRFVPGSALTRIVAAQSAQLTGDRENAERAFRAMLDDPDTRALGLRGLYVEAHRRGDAVAARDFAELALRSTPEAPWAGPALFDFQCLEGDWPAALATVERNTANRVIDRATAKRQRAVLLTAEALGQAGNEPDAALDKVLEAVKLVPGLIPSAALAARLLAESGDVKRAMKIVETAWKEEPHPDLAAVYLRARHGDTAQDRLKKARTLSAKNTSSPEGALALARAALDAREFQIARTALKVLIEAGPTVRTCLLMAEIEDADTGDRAAARGWLARAVGARPDHAWVADGAVFASWSPVSPISGKLDAVHWVLPQNTLGQAAPTLENIPHVTVAPPPAAVPVTASQQNYTPQTPVSNAQAFIPPPPDDPGISGNPARDEGEPSESQKPAFGPP